MSQVVFSPDTISRKLKIVAGTHVTVAAADEIVLPQVTTIVSATATLNSDPGADPEHVSATFSGNTLTLKTWKTDGADPTPVAATTFGKTVNYIVVGY
jgi:calcineurin-like phosphoesterase